MAKFYTDRYWFKYGNEYDEVECTTKVWNSFEKAQAYAYRYAKGPKFYYVEIIDEDCNLLWSYNYMSEEEDYRKEEKEETEVVNEEVVSINIEKRNTYKPIKAKAFLKGFKIKKVITLGREKIKPLKLILEPRYIRGSPEIIKNS